MFIIILNILFKSVLIVFQMPRLFIGRKYVGGKKEIAELDESGMLKRMLVVVRALEHL